jgi:hypothetical protein
MQFQLMHYEERQMDDKGSRIICDFSITETFVTMET